MKQRWPVLAAFIVGLVIPLLAGWGCSKATSISIGNETEMSRSTSPDGRLDAVVMQDNPGAFSSYQYFLYFVPKGNRVSDTNDNPYIVSTSEGDELKVLWKSAHFINIDPGNSHVKFFANYWYSAKMPDYGVELDYLQLSSRHYLRPDGSFHSSSD